MTCLKLKYGTLEKQYNVKTILAPLMCFYIHDYGQFSQIEEAFYMHKLLVCK